MTYDEMIELLKSGVDAEGKSIDLDRLNCGRKNIDHLWHEVEGSDVKLTRDRVSGRIIRSAQTVVMDIMAEHYNLMVVRQEYPNNGDVLKGILKHPSETRKRGEGVDEAIKWGMREELGVEIDDKQIHFLHDIHYHRYSNVLAADEILLHESSVYVGLKSCSFIQRRMVLFEKMFRPRGKVTKDSGSIVFFKWVDVQTDAEK
jgi:hypothetical protein